jgi:hypothetical protein
MTAKRKPVTPKAGLAARIRAWASRQPDTWSPVDVCDALDMPYGDRKKIRQALKDFVLRGEVERVETGVYRYMGNPASLARSTLKLRILKACYVAGPSFTVADVMRWAEAPDRSWVQEVLRGLVRSGHLARAGWHKTPQARVNLYRVPDRTRFRKEVL